MLRQQQYSNIYRLIALKYSLPYMFKKATQAKLKMKRNDSNKTAV